MTEATPRPWSAPEGMGFAGGVPYTGIGSPEGCIAWVLCNSRIPITGKDTSNPWEANAALIVRAVNAHDGLVDAVKTAIGVVDQGSPIDIEQAHHLRRQFKAARALAKEAAP